MFMGLADKLRELISRSRRANDLPSSPYLCPTVYLVCFHKAGRTWLKVIFSKLVKDLGYDPRRVTLLPFSHAAYSEPVGGPVRTTETISGNPRELSFIVLFRDPRDIVVSYYFECNLRLNKYHGSLSEFIRDEFYGIASIVAYYNEWQANVSNLKKVMWTSYESMQANGTDELSRIVDFAGLREQITVRGLKDAVAYGSFENMRQMEMSGKSFLGDQSLDINTRGDADVKESFKTRKGQVGGYLNYLSVQDIEYVNAETAKLDPFLLEIFLSGEFLG